MKAGCHMKHLTKLYTSIALLMALGCSLTAHADGPKMLYTESKIRFMNGGIGHDEVVEMRPFAKNYTLNLLFSEGKIGRAVTDVYLTIYNAQDEQVFKLKSAGPLLYINLPAGSYTISANNHGMKLRHKLNIEDSTPQKVILNWKDKVEEDDLVRE